MHDEVVRDDPGFETVNGVVHPADDAEFLKSTFLKPLRERGELRLVGVESGDDPVGNGRRTGIGGGSQFVEAPIGGLQGLGPEQQVVTFTAPEELRIALSEVDEVAGKPVGALQLELRTGQRYPRCIERVAVLLVVENDRNERGGNADAQQESQQ